MNPKLKELQEQHAAKSAEAQELLNKTDATPEDAIKAAEIINKELPALKADIEALQSVDGLKANLEVHQQWANTPAQTLPQPGMKSQPAGQTEFDLLTGEVVKDEGVGVLTEPQIKAIANRDYLNAFKSYIRNPRGFEGIKSADARKSLTEGIDTEGGFLVPAEMQSRIIAREATPTRIVDLVQTINVSSDRAQWLKSNYNADDLYATGVRVYKTAEGGTVPKTEKPLFGTMTINVHSFTAELSISRELLEDAAFDILGYIAEQFRIAYRNHSASRILSGSGVGEHFGILTRAGTANGPEIINSGAAGALTFDGLQKLKFAVPEQYDQNGRFIFNKKSTGLAIASLKDADNRPLWPVQQQAGMVNGEPANLFGYSYAYEAFMPDVAANKLPVIFGDPRGYVRVLRTGMSIEVLREVGAQQGMVIILARFREGGDVAEPWRLKVQKVAA